MDITTTKIKAGHYSISREDGKTFEVIRGVGRWFLKGENGTFGSRKNLGDAQYDIKMGYIQ